MGSPASMTAYPKVVVLGPSSLQENFPSLFCSFRRKAFAGKRVSLIASLRTANGIKYPNSSLGNPSIREFHGSFIELGKKGLNTVGTERFPCGVGPKVTHMRQFDVSLLTDCPPP